MLPELHGFEFISFRSKGCIERVYRYIRCIERVCYVMCYQSRMALSSSRSGRKGVLKGCIDI